MARRGEGWRGGVIGLNDAANRLGVHYMTVYRYIRTGRLPAVKVAGVWQVLQTDVDRLSRQERVTKVRGSGRDWATNRMLDRLLAGDEVGAWAVSESALASGAAPADVHLELLAPALRAIGEGWEAGVIDVGVEHRATVVARRIISRLGPQFNRRGRKRGVVVLGAVAGERHEIPAAMVADQLRGAGFEVADLGADTPAVSFVAEAKRLGPVCVLVSVTSADLELAVDEAVKTLRAGTAAPILVGGAAVPDEQAALAMGSERWTGSDARHVVASVDELLGA